MTTNLGGDAKAGTLASTETNSDMSLGIEWHNIYIFECYDADGNLKWRDEILNTVMDVGANDLLAKYFTGSTYTATWYVGLTSTNTFANSDTPSSHPGWAEFTAYSQTNRPTWTGGSASARSISNSGSQATFSINGAGGTVGGAFLISNNTISGTTGILYGGAQLSSSRTLASGDTLNITVTMSV